MNPIATLETTEGNVEIELFENNMPVTSGNFKKLAEDGFYNGIVFHRIIPNFMIQGGCPDGNGMGGPGYTIEDEFTPENANNRGTISMANSGPNSGGSQFFINMVDNNYLDPKHPVFGKIVNGMDIIDSIGKTETDGMDKPVQEIKIQKVTIRTE